MEYTLKQECQDIVDAIVDSSICMDCEHPRCLDRSKSFAKKIEQLVLTAKQTKD